MFLKDIGTFFFMRERHCNFFIYKDSELPEEEILESNKKVTKPFQYLHLVQGSGISPTPN
jgi:hypothetical protein